MAEEILPDLYFNPHSPQGGATFTRDPQPERERFQSTLPARGSDLGHGEAPHKPRAFQSTLPARGSDAIDAQAAQESKISIHTSRKGERRG